jgi:hypothetical protein
MVWLNIRVAEPVFILSLGRSGSTLLQRALACHSEISASGETWLLLPHLSGLRTHGIYADYTHANAVRGIEDFAAQLPGGIEEYKAELREFVVRLFTKSAREARYFVDKTPRYALAIHEILDVFPECKLIFLWRNPLAIIASYINSFGTPGKWALYSFELPLTVGLSNLVAGYEAARHRALGLRYEDLVSDPEGALERILEYLDLPFEPDMLDLLADTKFKGRYGDPTGTHQYSSIVSEPLEKWKTTLRNPLRKAWCSRYLRWLGRERLAVMGYDIDDLIAALNAVPVSADHIVSDGLRMFYGRLWRMREENILKKEGERRFLLDDYVDRRKKRGAASARG